MFGALPNRKNVIIPSATNSKIMRQVMCDSIMYRIMTDVFWKSVCKLSRHKEIDLVPEIRRTVFLSPIIVDVVSVSEHEDSPTAGCFPCLHTGPQQTLLLSTVCSLERQNYFIHNLELLSTDFADDYHRSNFFRLNKIPVIFKLRVFSYLKS